MNLDKFTRPNIHFINEKKRAKSKKVQKTGMSTHYSSRFMLKKPDEIDENDYLEYDSTPVEDSKSFEAPNIKEWVDYKKEKAF